MVAATRYACLLLYHSFLWLYGVRLGVLSEGVRQNSCVFTSVMAILGFRSIDIYWWLCYNGSNNQGNVVKHFGDWEH